MLERLEGVEQRYLEVEQLLSDPQILSDRDAYQKAVREHAELDKVVTVFREYKKCLTGIVDNKELLKDPDPDIKEMAKEELDTLSSEKDRLEQALKVLLLPRDPNDDKNVILEIRAGTGGEEASLFASNLFRMYSRYAETRGFKVEILDHHYSMAGGFKEIIAMIQGGGAYSAFKYESGTHRVQRVPSTEAQGRIHTSAVTVAVLPEAEEVDVHIDPNDIKVDVYRSTGPGGQSVNTTDSAVRITHLPTGLVVTCQDEKSQHKNKARALKVLRARLYDREVQEQQTARSQQRRDQVGSGDRSERIRTYNYPQNRITDHRIGLTLYKLDSVMEGNLQEVMESLTTFFNAEALKAGI